MNDVESRYHPHRMMDRQPRGCVELIWRHVSHAPRDFLQSSMPSTLVLGRFRHRRPREGVELPGHGLHLTRCRLVNSAWRRSIMAMTVLRCPAQTTRASHPGGCLLPRLTSRKRAVSDNMSCRRRPTDRSRTEMQKRRDAERQESRRSGVCARLPSKVETQSPTQKYLF